MTLDYSSDESRTWIRLRGDRRAPQVPSTRQKETPRSTRCSARRPGPTPPWPRGAASRCPPATRPRSAWRRSIFCWWARSTSRGTRARSRPTSRRTRPSAGPRTRYWRASTTASAARSRATARASDRRADVGAPWSLLRAPRGAGAFPNARRFGGIPEGFFSALGRARPRAARGRRAPRGGRGPRRPRGPAPPPPREHPRRARGAGDDPPVVPRRRRRQRGGVAAVGVRFNSFSEILVVRCCL